MCNLVCTRIEAAIVGWLAATIAAIKRGMGAANLNEAAFIAAITALVEARSSHPTELGSSRQPSLRNSRRRPFEFWAPRPSQNRRKRLYGPSRSHSEATAPHGSAGGFAAVAGGGVGAVEEVNFSALANAPSTGVSLAKEYASVRPMTST